MHQIRAHLCEKGYPVVGDKIYGPDEMLFLEFLKNGMNKNLKDKLIISRQFLHCWKIYFYHPYLDKNMVFKAPLPLELRTFIDNNV